MYIIIGNVKSVQTPKVARIKQEIQDVINFTL